MRQDRVKIAGGKLAFREVVEHPGAVAILALNDNEEIIMVRQYRQPAKELLLEIPAGKIDPHEDPIDCARREFLEETGLEAQQWEEVNYFFPSPGFCDEIIYLFQAHKLYCSRSLRNDPEENLTTVRVPLIEANKMINSRKIKDGKTIIAIQYALLRGSQV